MKGKLQKVSSGAALSVQAMANDHATYFEGSETIQQVIDEKAEIQNWKPAHLYVFTDRAIAKVRLTFPQILSSILIEKVPWTARIQY